MKSQIKLSDHFGFGRLLKYTLPSIIMLIFTSVYGVVDGVFVSSFTGKTEFAAVNFIYPFLMVLGAIGFMIGSGGSALIAKTLGEGNGEKANRLFSMFVAVTVVLGTAFSLIAFFIIEPVAYALGARDKMLEYCVLYGRILLIGLPVQMLQFEFQSFFVTAEKPTLGLIVTVCAGLTNIVFDALLVVVIPLGIVGAAIATVMSQFVGGVVPVIYFLNKKNTSLLKFGKLAFDGKSFFMACGNGSSEFLSNVSMSVVSMIYNAQLMVLLGEDGVAAYGVLMYVSFIFNACFIGFSVGSAPIVGYHYGAANSAEVKNILAKSLIIFVIGSVLMFGVAEALAYPLALAFCWYDNGLLLLTEKAFRIFSFSFIFAGFPILASSFFTALNNGAVSAVISFMRTLVFQTAAVFLLPLIMGVDGIWVSLIVSEVLATVVAIIFILTNRRKYGY